MQLMDQSGTIYANAWKRYLSDMAGMIWHIRFAVAEHVWKEHHPIRWQETSVIDRASRFGELRVKEALHIHLTPEDQRFNRDVGLELPGRWVSTLKALRVKPRPPPSV